MSFIGMSSDLPKPSEAVRPESLPMSGEVIQSRSQGLGRYGWSHLVLIATVLFGFATRWNGAGTGLAVTLAVLALGVGGLRRRFSTGTTDASLLAAILVFAALIALGWSPSTIGPTNPFLERGPAVAWSLLAIILYLSAKRERQVPILVAVVAFTLATALAFGIWHLNSARDFGLDVTLLHIEAAEALSNGQNPYSEAVSVPDGSPLAEPGDMIVGYPYPPMTAIGYAAGEWSLDDPRYTSLLSWVAVLSLMGWSAIRASSRTTVYLMLLMASIPGWPLVLRTGWTEPFSLILISVAFFVWSNVPASGTTLGLALASKQYFVVAASVLVAHRDRVWLRRAVVAGVVVAVTVSAALLIDPDAFWSAAIEFHARTPPRTDSANLVGLLGSLGFTLTPPTILSMGLGLVAGFLAGRRSHFRQTFVTAVAFALAFAFLVSSQAFANYWFLVTGLCILGLMPASDEAAES